MRISLFILLTIFISVEVSGGLHTPVFGSATPNPGLQTHITAAGLNYANEVATSILTKSLKGKTIPDQSGKSGHATYSVTQLQIREFTNPASSIKLAPPGGLAWQASNINVDLHGNFKYSYKKVIKIKGHGSFDVKVERMTFGLKMLIGADGNGRPTIETSGCASNIGDVHVKFHGGQAWIYNLFKKKVAEVIKKTLNEKLCSIIVNMVNVDGGKALAKLKVKTKIGNKFLLDYRLLKPPVFTSNYLETTHKGEVYWASAVKDVPFNATVFPNVGGSSRMFYIWLSDYVINSMVYQAQKHDFLAFNMTAKDLPAGNRSLLNTTCDPAPCIGTLIPALKNLPGCQVELHMKSNFVPNISIVNGEIKTRAGGDITLLAACPKHKDLKFLFTLNVNGTADVSLAVKGQLVHFKMGDAKLQMKVTKTDIKGISELGLQILKTIIEKFVLTKINDLGAKGFPLPLTDEIQLTNTSLLLKQDTLLIATDIKYG